MELACRGWPKPCREPSTRQRRAACEASASTRFLVCKVSKMRQLADIEAAVIFAPWSDEVRCKKINNAIVLRTPAAKSRYR